MRTAHRQRLGLGIFLQLFAISNGIAKDSVDETFAMLRRQLNRFVDGGMFGNVREKELIQSEL